MQGLTNERNFRVLSAPRPEGLAVYVNCVPRRRAAARRRSRRGTEKQRFSAVRSKRGLSFTALSRKLPYGDDGPENEIEVR